MEELRDKVYRFLKSRTDDAELAADLTQETLLKILAKEQDVDNLDAWSIQVAKNLLVDHFRKNQRKSTELMTQPIDYNALTDDMLGCQEIFIDELDEESKNLLKAVDIKGVSQKDLARSLGIPYPSLRAKIQRTRKKIKARFEETCEFEFDSAGAVVCCWEKNCSR